MNLKNVFRISEWKNSHLLLILTGFIIFSLINSVEFNLFIKNISYLFITALFVGSYGYYINDVFDVEADLKVGKRNFASKHSSIQRLLIIFFLLFSTFICWYLISKNNTVLYLLIFESLILFLYAAPKIRIKERVYLSLIFDSFYAFVVWGIIILVLTKTDFAISSFIYLSWLFLFGLRGILAHHIADYHNDLQSNTTTTATRFGIDKVQVFQKFVIPPIELMLFLILLFFIDKIYILFYIAYLLISFKNGEIFPKYDRIRYLKTETNLLAKFTENFYFGWLPLITLVTLVFIDFWYGFVSVIFVLLFFKQFQQVYNSIIKIVTPFYYLIFGISSYIVNHSLYYFFLLFRIDLKERAAKNKNNITVENERNTVENGARKTPALLSNTIKEKKINSLWIGDELSNMELLTVHSFLQFGYEFHLWTYQELKNIIPSSVVMHDANEIIPFEQVFSYKNSTQFGIGKGSLAGFSDIFRYKLLYEKGGWWVDMDVTCLKPFDVDGDYFFRAHHELEVVGNIMKVPPYSPLMLNCYQQAKTDIDSNNTDWYKPIKILVENIKSHHLTDFIFEDVSNTDEFQKIEHYYFGNAKFPENWVFIHWGNEVLRSYQLSKNNSFFNSTYSQLLKQYKLLKTPLSIQKFDLDFKRELLFANLKKML